jgi:hypothetical protein
MSFPGFGKTACLLALLGLGLVAGWCYADCNANCLEVNCWQVDSSPPPSFNCRKTEDQAKSLCRLSDFGPFWHLPAPYVEGGVCEDEGTGRLYVQQCTYCNPECPYIPDKAGNCGGDCSYYGSFVDTYCNKTTS